MAVDLEFTGLFLDADDSSSARSASLQEYYTRCITSIPSFLPLQLGICCAHQRDDVWELRVHEFNLWPSKRLFVSDFKSLQFLREHGFDFNSYLEQGFTYSRLDPAKAKRPKRNNCDANQLIRALRSAKALAVHNGLLDLLHLYHGFIGDLPKDVNSFCEAWLSEFPLLLDTRHLAQEGRYHILKLAGGLSLEHLNRHLSASDPVPGLAAVGASSARTTHGSAGQDALLTAKVLLMQMQLWIANGLKESREKEEERHRLKRLQELEKELPSNWQDVHQLAADCGVSIYRCSELSSGPAGRFGGAKGARRPVLDIRRDIAARRFAEEVGAQDASAKCGAEEVVSKDSLMSPAIRPFHNVLAIVGASPGHLCLEKIPSW